MTENKFFYDEIDMKNERNRGYWQGFTVSAAVILVVFPLVWYGLGLLIK